MKRILFLCFTLLLCSALPAQTTDRVKRRAKNRAENKVNNKVDRAVDDAVDEAFNALFGKKKKKTTPKPESDNDDDRRDDDSDYDDDDAANSALGSLFGNNDFEPYKNERSFTVVMETVEEKKNGKTETVVMTIGALPTMNAMHLPGEKDGESVRMLFDTQTGKTTTITTEKGKTEGMRMRMPNFSAMAARQAEKETEKYTFERTGRRRTIDGYNCELIIGSDGEGTRTEAWITEDAGVTMADMFGGVAGMFGGGNAKGSPISESMPPFEGIAIESTSTDKKGKVVTMKMKEIRIGESKVDRSLFSTDGIVIQDVPGF